MASSKQSSISRPLCFLAGAAIGSACTFYFDPVRGRARRALTRDKTVRFINETSRYSDRQLRNLSNRIQGTLARANSLLRANEVPDDETLIQRVRSEMGRKVKNPGLIEVTAVSGFVTLKGQVPLHESEALIQCVRRVRGVKHIDNELEVRETRETPQGIAADGRVYM